MKNISIRLSLFIFLVVLVSFSTQAQSINGLWDAEVSVNGTPIPFQIELSGSAGDLHSYFFNGTEKVNPSSSGTFQNGSLVLNFDSYATRLEAALHDGVLAGTYFASPTTSYPFQARRHEATVLPAAKQKVPDINGVWEIQVKSPKGESAWRFIVNQTGSRISASILRVDGDTGVLAGTFKDGKFVLSHFTGERPYYLEVTPAPDGTLHVSLASYHDKQDLVALRPELREGERARST